MPITNFPFGVSSFGIPLVGSGPVLTTGKVFFVDSTTGLDAEGRGTDPSTPFKTLAYAVTKGVTNKGDTILVMPSHAENITSAGGITISIAGLTVLGLGTGTSRPTFYFTVTASASFVINAANTLVKNVVFNYHGVDAVTPGVSITAADVTIDECQFDMANATSQAAVAVTLGANANNCTIKNCRFDAPVAGADAAIAGSVAVNKPTFIGNIFYGNFNVAAIRNVTNAWTNVFISSNFYYGTNASKPIVSLVATATGIIHGNMSGCPTFSANGSIVANGCYKFLNYVTDTASGTSDSGVLDPPGVTL